MPRALSDQVVVVTGASSGVARETALLLAERGATVVLAARNEEALNQVAAEVSRLGGTAHVRVTDVSQWEQVDALAGETVERFGRIDTWVSCAAVSLYGKFADVSAEEFARVVQVNLLGHVWGTKAALSRMQEQGAGAIVNVASALALQATPLQSAYVASKHGILGFTEALRMELEHDGSPITVSTIMPSSINTPLFQHARSRMGVQPQPMPPVYQPRVVAEALVHVIEHPQPYTVVGGAGKLMGVMHRLAPRLTGTVMLRVGNAAQSQRTDQPADGTDNLFEPSRGPGAVEGTFGQKAKSTSVYTTVLEQHPNRIRALLAGAVVGGLVLVRRVGR